MFSNSQHTCLYVLDTKDASLILYLSETKADGSMQFRLRRGSNFLSFSRYVQLRKFDGGCQSLLSVNSRSARKKGSQEGGRESTTVLISKLNDSVGLEVYDT